jgi:hypothetical protein
MPFLKRTFFPRLHYFAVLILAFLINFTCEYSVSYILFDIMTFRTRSQSIVITRPSFPKPGRLLITKDRMCQRYVRDY